MKRFYHREDEKRLLARTLRAADKEHPLVLISGSSGTGKTSLARTLEVPYFVEAKFDALQPFGDFRQVLQAVDQLLEKVVVRGQGEASVQQRIQSKMDAQADRLLFESLPTLPGLCGLTTTVTVTERSARATGSQKRMMFSLCKLLSSIATMETPLVVFLDDIQWAGSATIEFLSTLLSEASVPGLLVVAACRSDEITVDHRFAVLLRELETVGVDILNIAVSNFTCAEVEDIVKDIAVDLTGAEASRLSVVIHKQTEGTIFFVLQLIKGLVDHGTLETTSAVGSLKSVDSALAAASAWTVDTWLSNKVEAMSDDVRETLVTASCFGAQFETAHLLAIASTNAALDGQLRTLCDMGLVEPSKPDEWRFQHDQIQQRTYALIPESERDNQHLRIGRLLWSAYNDRPEGEVDLGTVILQLRMGARLLTDQAERDRVASLVLHAGEQAAASSSFAASVSYLDLAMELLGARHWKDEYFLSLNVYNTAAEIEYCIGNFDRALELVEVVLANARNEDDKSRATMLRIFTLSSERRIQEAIDLSLDDVSKAGVFFPRAMLLPRMLVGYNAMKRKLAALSDEDILSRPHAIDHQSRSTLNVLALLIDLTATGRQSLIPFVAFRIVDFTLKNGLSSASAMGFAGLSVLMSIGFGEIDASKRFAELSLAILDRFDNTEWHPRVLLLVHSYCFTWDQSLRLHLKPMLTAHRLALCNGDIYHAVMTAAVYSNMALHAALDLQQLRDDTRIFVRLAEMHNQLTAKGFLLLNLQFMANLMDNPTSPSTMDGECMAEETFLRMVHDTKNQSQADLFLLSKIQLHSFFHEYEAGCEAMIKVEKKKRRTYTPNAFMRHHFHAGLCCAMSSIYRKQAKRHLRALCKMADRNEEYVRHKALLLDAVLDAMNGAPAFSKFDESIEMARADLLWNEVGLACEHAAKLASRMGQSQHAIVYAKQALEAYKTWGAHTKVRMVQREFNLE